MLTVVDAMPQVLARSHTHDCHQQDRHHHAAPTAEGGLQQLLHSQKCEHETTQGVRCPQQWISCIGAKCAAAVHVLGL